MAASSPRPTLASPPPVLEVLLAGLARNAAWVGSPLMPVSAPCAARLRLGLREQRQGMATCFRESASRSSTCLSKSWSLLIAHPSAGTGVQMPVRHAGEKVTTMFELARGSLAVQTFESLGKGLLLASDSPGGAGRRRL